VGLANNFGTVWNVIHDESHHSSQAAPRRLHSRLFWLLRLSGRAAEQLTQERLAGAGLRRGFYGVLASLVEFGPSAQADIGRRLGVDRSDMVAILNDLETEGYVRREPDPTDRRRNSVVITRAGRGALTRFDRAIIEAEKTTLAALTPAERETLIGLLQRVVGTTQHG